MSFSDLFEPLLPEMNVFPTGLLRLLLEGVQHVQGIANAGNMERAELPSCADTHFAHAGANGLHGFPIQRFKPLLYT
jgi:hypothetical protein